MCTRCVLSRFQMLHLPKLLILHLLNLLLHLLLHSVPLWKEGMQWQVRLGTCPSVNVWHLVRKICYLWQTSMLSRQKFAEPGAYHEEAELHTPVSSPALPSAAPACAGWSLNFGSTYAALGSMSKSEVSCVLPTWSIFSVSVAAMLAQLRLISCRCIVLKWTFTSSGVYPESEKSVLACEACLPQSAAL
jgi:hypothetical protein